MMLAAHLAGGTPVYSFSLSFERSGLIPVASVFGVNPDLGEIRDFLMLSAAISGVCLGVSSTASESSG